jgi:hypothetical protein
MAWSADDVEIVTDLHDAASHPRGADHRVASAQVRTWPRSVTVLPLVSTRRS